MGMKALGNTIGAPVLIGDGVYVSMIDADCLTFLCYLAGAAGDVYTFTQAKTAGGGSSKAYSGVTRYYTADGVGGVWTEQSQAAGSTVTTTATTAQNGMIVEVMAAELDDGFKYLKLTSTGAGLVTVLPTSIKVGRRLSNLVSVTA